jgi:hypothetical protein
MAAKLLSNLEGIVLNYVESSLLRIEVSASKFRLRSKGVTSSRSLKGLKGGI